MSATYEVMVRAAEAYLLDNDWVQDKTDQTRWHVPDWRKGRWPTRAQWPAYDLWHAVNSTKRYKRHEATYRLQLRAYQPSPTLALLPAASCPVHVSRVHDWRDRDGMRWCATCGVYEVVP